MLNVEKPLERTGKHCKECFNIDNWKTTYPPQGIRENIMNKGFFHKTIHPIWDIKEEEE